MSASIDEIELLSVGVDVGSSTSHLVFSKLLLRKDSHSSSRRFIVVQRDIVYEGKIIDTPLLDQNTIDVASLSSFFKSEYKRAGVHPDDIQTGAVIVTGETAKKQNAKEIVEAISSDAGKFVAATAGPNFESLIAALGSGMTGRSQEEQSTILSVDIGGGTSNMAISSNGEVISTACVSVGGRLLAIDENSRISRIDNPAKIVMEHLNLQYQVGDTMSESDLQLVAASFAGVLLEVITGPTHSELARKLMMTSDLDFSLPINEYSYSGGVAEMIYGDNGAYQDMGHILAIEIKKNSEKLLKPLIEPQNKIRATVIGAGAYSLSISGSTCFLDENLDFPIKNIPIVRVDIDREILSPEHVTEQIGISFERFDIQEGSEVVGLYFKDPVRAAYSKLKLFATSIEKALPNSVQSEIPIILIFERDIANSVGNVIRRETVIKDNLLSLDELSLKEGDWIDIGSPLVNGQVFPITVKSLVFNKK